LAGIVLLGHGEFAKGLLDTSEMVAGPQEKVVAVPLSADISLSEYRERVEEACGRVDSGAGVLLLVDLKGGTPSNVAVLISHDRGYRVISGANVPMLVAVLLSRESLDLSALAELARSSGAEGVEQLRLGE